jgi:hypothetical protein
MRDTCIVSIMRGRDYENELGARLLANKRAWCERCGYRCILSNQTFTEKHGRSPHWDKLLLLLESLHTCGTSMWVDADTVVRRPFAVPLRAPSHVGAARDYGGFNSGVMMFARSHQAKRLLRLAWNQTRFAHGVWEQTALRAAMAAEPALQAGVRIYENIVSYPTFMPPFVKRNRTHLARAAPLYHVAGCFLLTRKLKRCHDWLGSELERARMNATCANVDESLIGPRPLKTRDLHVDPSHGRRRPAAT